MGTDVRVRRLSAQAGRMADLLHGVGVGMKRRSLLLWHAVTGMHTKRSMPEDAMISPVTRKRDLLM